MTAAKIDALTSCRWPDCTASVARRNLCSRHYCRAQSLVRDGAHWSDDPRVWVALWEDRAARIKAKRRATGLRNLHGVEPVTLPRADAECKASGTPIADVRDTEDLAEVRKHLSRWSAPERTVADMAAAARSYVAEVEQEGGHYARLCQAAHDTLDAAQAPGGSSPDVRIAWLSDARRRADDALFRLRAAIADAVGIDGEVPADAVLVRRLRELDSDGDDRNIAVERDVIGTCTATIRKVVCSEQDAVGLAVDGLCEVIERTVGVRS